MGQQFQVFCMSFHISQYMWKKPPTIFGTEKETVYLHDPKIMTFPTVTVTYLLMLPLTELSLVTKKQRCLWTM